MDKQDIQEQLDAWRGKLDELRVKAHLLKMEYRDKPDEVLERLESAYDKAKAKFASWRDAGETEATGIAAGFTAAWTAFKDAYRDATER